MTSDLLKSYANTALDAKVAGADPHGLVGLLLDGAIEKIGMARSHLQHGNIAAKGAHISWAISIIGGLRGGLDMEQGGEIAARLDALYDYMERRLFQANLDNDPKALQEVVALLTTIREGWNSIPSEFRQGTRPTL